MNSDPLPDEVVPASLDVRPPLQRRSREAWNRVLDEGVGLLEEAGYQGFTIAAVCERAQVAPRAIYARVDTKDALFLAVYEHGIARLRVDQEVFQDKSRWQGLSAQDAADQAVREMAGIFERHAAMLRSIVLVSGAHPEVYRRGAIYTRQLGDQVTAVLLAAGAGTGEPDPEAAVRAAFEAVFSTLVLRTAYGPAFVVPATDRLHFLSTLTAMIRRYLQAGR